MLRCYVYLNASWKQHHNWFFNCIFWQGVLLMEKKTIGLVICIFKLTKLIFFSILVVVQVAAVIASLVSLSWSLVSYQRSLRMSLIDKKNMTWMVCFLLIFFLFFSYLLLIFYLFFLIFYLFLLNNLI